MASAAKVALRRSGTAICGRRRSGARVARKWKRISVPISRPARKNRARRCSPSKGHAMCPGLTPSTWDIRAICEPPWIQPIINAPGTPRLSHGPFGGFTLSGGRLPSHRLGPVLARRPSRPRLGPLGFGRWRITLCHDPVSIAPHSIPLVWSTQIVGLSGICWGCVYAVLCSDSSLPIHLCHTGHSRTRPRRVPRCPFSRHLKQVACFHSRLAR